MSDRFMRLRSAKSIRNINNDRLVLNIISWEEGVAAHNCGSSFILSMVAQA